MSQFWDIAGRIGYDSLAFILRAMGKAKREAFKHFQPWDQRIKDGSDSVILTNNTQPPPNPPVKPYKNRMIIIGQEEERPKVITVDDLREDKNGTDK